MTKEPVDKDLTSTLYNEMIKLNGYYQSISMSTEQGYKKDDIMMKVNTDIGDVFGWINQGNETTSNFKTYCQGGIKA